MSELIEFDDFHQIRSLLRAGIELKFELSEGGHVLDGSPIYAAALNNLREGWLQGLRATLTPREVQAKADWYQLSQHRERFEIVARRVTRLPGWRERDAVDFREWVEALAAPFTVDDETLETIKAAAEEKQRLQ
ncbi:hypothetical protein [Saccharomonospora piscinae]|uniref:hypothetical protein n=1 Tax=Saccharomonospora piscinae TaxID=687388 RepID=UPI0012DEF87E|nr:hypothetical protein [Saccharomonospora piscinae]